MNAFGPWRSDPSTLRVAGTDGFTRLRFERKLPIRGVNRQPPNLDVVAEGRTTVAIESKLIEQLERAKPAYFDPVYDGAVAELAHPTWAQVFSLLRDNPRRYRHFGAAQVVKHYLGMKSADFGAARLLYLFWEPGDHAVYPLFAAHRSEAADFASRLRDPQIEFVAMPYDELCVDWKRRAEPPWITQHVENLAQRYGVRLAKELTSSPRSR